jgi:acid stress-induced BolA-like protein IbaG/YrbA
MDPQEIKRLIEQATPGATASVTDTGGGNHFQAVVVSSQFEGKSMLEQHRLVYDALARSIEDETVHAMALRTLTPEESEQHR